MYYVISDVHGYYDEMMEALNKAGFDYNNPEHCIINLGDSCDRGPKSKEVLEFLMGLYNQNRATLILGNHEDMLKEAITRGYFMMHDIHNGATKTATQLTGIGDADDALKELYDNELWSTYLGSCIDYYETEHYVFVHGWIPIKEVIDDSVAEDEDYKDLPKEYWPTKRVYDPNWRRNTEDDGFTWGDVWSDARWLNGMKMWNEGIREPGKTIVCGHFHASWGNSYLHNDGREWLEQIETYYIDPETGKKEPHVNYDIFCDDGIRAIDACTALSHQVNVLVLKDEEL